MSYNNAKIMNHANIYYCTRKRITSPDGIYALGTNK